MAVAVPDVAGAGASVEEEEAGPGPMASSGDMRVRAAMLWCMWHATRATISRATQAGLRHQGCTRPLRPPPLPPPTLPLRVWARGATPPSLLLLMAAEAAGPQKGRNREGSGGPINSLASWAFGEASETVR